MKSAWIDLTKVEGEKGKHLRESAQNGSLRLNLDPRSLEVVPKTPFCYWAPKALLDCFRSMSPLESSGYEVRVGLQTSSDARFLRLAWEAPPSLIGEVWVPLSKGGGFSRFYSDLHMVIGFGRWGTRVGAELKAFVETLPGTTHWSRRLASYESYRRPGVTWTQRTQSGLSLRVLPHGCVFGIKGPAILAVDNGQQSLSALVALANSSVFRSLVGMQMTFGSFDVGVLQRTPLPAGASSDRLAAIACRGWSLRRSLDTVAESSHAFAVPAVVQVEGSSFGRRVVAWAARVAGVEDELAVVQFEIDELCFELYGIADEDRVAITEGFGVSSGDDEAEVGDEDEAADELVVEDPAGLAAGLVSWAVGVGVGRFDVRLATGERERPVDPEPFDPLPVCSPAMLTGDDGLPLVEPPAGYPVAVSPVLVDDPGHRLDIGVRVRSVFDVVFGAGADDWWTDVGDALGSKRGEIGAWLSKGFFDHHLKTHSKSRRKAPILWPIGTVSGSYTVWLYAHRVTADSLFQVLNDLVDPKLSVEQRRLAELTQEAGPNPVASQRKVIDVQEKLVGELRELRIRLEAVAPLWAPDLNDGIVIVLAPLWQLFAQHRSWSKELKKHWDKLAAGDYDWSQLAMHLWPERVVPKCAEDRSLAIAHGLEDVFWVRDDDNDDKWHPRSHPTTPIDGLIADRHNPTIATALQQATQ